ncbi:MAG: apolipoprotein N-acyltransferase [Hahellaceae bacterium]|nr:apolipoprotein N-acyltransferase [Hahellaceae bacterium]
MLLPALLSLVSGALLPAAFAPFDFKFAAVACPMALALILRHKTPRQAAWLSWLFGLGLFGTGVSWVFVSIHVHGPAPVWLAAFLTALFVMGIALFTALQGWFFATLSGQSGFTQGLRYLLLFSAVWVLGEWFRTWFLSGFPWLFLGHSMLKTPLAGFAPIGGIYLVSFSVLVLGSLLLTLAAHFRSSDRQPQKVLALLLGLTLLIGTGQTLYGVDWTHPENRELSVGLVQPNIPQEDKWVPDQQLPQIRKILSLHRQLTDQDIVIWPETALPLFLAQAGPVLDELDQQGKADRQAILLGILSAERDAASPVETPRYHIYNSFLATGNGEGLYHKQRLVPFGEYVPFASALRGLIQFFDLPMSDMASGGSQQTLLTAGAYHFMPFICYEIVYPDLVAAHASEADFLVTVSNDTWFGASAGPLQHLQMAQMRALENQKPLLRGTNNGVTAIINYQGEITDRLPQFEAGVLRSTFTPRTGSTPFNLNGSWPVILMLLLQVSLPVILRKYNPSQR